MKKVDIHTPYITLGQLLKFLNLVNSGGEAKLFLQENEIYVNEVAENRRGKKLYPGDEININDLEILIGNK